MKQKEIMERMAFVLHGDNLKRVSVFRNQRINDGVWLFHIHRRNMLRAVNLRRTLRNILTIHINAKNAKDQCI